MAVYAISDLHLSFSTDKPMDIFGGKWDNYWEKICEDWRLKVGVDDVVLIAGDISWGMNLEQAAADIDAIRALPGKKVIIRGNHDYWWSSYSKVRALAGEDITALQNNCARLTDDLLVCGSRGWQRAEEGDDAKIYNRELLRMRMSLDDMKKRRNHADRVIVMTHYPPFNVTLENNEMTDLIMEYDVDAVVYGHLHGRHCRAERRVQKGRTLFYLTSCDMVENTLVKILD